MGSPAAARGIFLLVARLSLVCWIVSGRTPHLGKGDANEAEPQRLWSPSSSAYRVLAEEPGTRDLADEAAAADEKLLPRAEQVGTGTVLA